MDEAVDQLPEPPAVVVSVREPLVALGEVRWRRAKRSTNAFMVAGLVQVAGGLVLALVPDDPAWQNAGAAVFAGGAVQTTQGWYQQGLARRRHEVLLEDLEAVWDRPEAWPGLASSERRSAERESRAFAFGSGVYGGMFGAGALFMFSAIGNENPRAAFTTSAAISLVGGIGLIHHTTRWRAGVRIAGDLDLLDEQIPTVIP